MADAYPVTLCGILMDGVTPDPDGVLWGVASLEGWDAAPVRGDDNDLTGRHGGWGPSRLFAARPLTLTGIAHCPDAAAAFAARNRLHAMPAITDEGVLVRHEPQPMQVTVRRAPAPLRASMPLGDLPHPYVKWQIPLVAFDPFKRATAGTTFALASGATVTATNAGTAPASMVVTLTSSGTVVLTAGGATLTTGTLPSGAVIDTGATSIVDSSGAELDTAILLPPGWPSVPSGGGSITQAGTAALSVTTYDTYA